MLKIKELKKGALYYDLDIRLRYKGALYLNGKRHYVFVNTELCPPEGHEINKSEFLYTWEKVKKLSKNKIVRHFCNAHGRVLPCELCRTQDYDAAHIGFTPHK